MIAKNLRICIKCFVGFCFTHLSFSLPFSISLYLYLAAACGSYSEFDFDSNAVVKRPKDTKNVVVLLLFLCLFLNTRFTFRRRHCRHHTEREIILFEIFNLVVSFSFFFFVLFLPLLWLIWFLQDSRYVACCLWRHYKYPREMWGRRASIHISKTTWGSILFMYLKIICKLKWFMNSELWFFICATSLC